LPNRGGAGDGPWPFAVIIKTVLPVWGRGFPGSAISIAVKTCTPFFPRRTGLWRTGTKFFPAPPAFFVPKKPPGPISIPAFFFWGQKRIPGGGGSLAGGSVVGSGRAGRRCRDRFSGACGACIGVRAWARAAACPPARNISISEGDVSVAPRGLEPGRGQISSGGTALNRIPGGGRTFPAVQGRSLGRNSCRRTMRQMSLL